MYREIYYIQARLYNDADMFKNREACAQMFGFVDKLIETYEGVKDVRHFELNDYNLISYQEKNLELIASSLKIVNAQ